MAETRKITFKNSSDGPRGVNGVNGVVMIEKGQSADVEVTEGEFRSAMRTGYFGEGEDGDDAKPLDRMNKAELLAAAADAGVEKAKDKEGNEIDIADGTNAQIREAIEAHANA